MTEETTRTVRVRSINNPKVNGKYRSPGSEWECPAHLVGELQELGAVEVLKEDPEPVDNGEKDSSEASVSASIIAAIGQVNPEDETLWTKESGPTTKALEAVLGTAVTAADRDAAWALFSEGTR